MLMNLAIAGRIAFATCLFLVLSPVQAATQVHGGKVEWARLKTPDKDWAIHSDRDPDLADFVRHNTDLNIRPALGSADPGNLEQLCSFPFIYAKDMMHVRRAEHLANLGEYLRRGGFICVDACSTTNVTPDLQAHLRNNVAVFQRLLPESRVARLPDDHPIYSCYFTVSEREIFTRDMGSMPASRDRGLYGIYAEDRMVAIVTLNGLQCGWPQTPLRKPGCVQMILNIYIYAMTAGPETDVPSE